jgi:sugar lactone lactonase YvrE
MLLPVLLLPAVFLGCQPRTSEPLTASPGDSAEPPDPAPTVLLASDYTNGEVLVLDPESGDLLDRLTGAAGAQALRWGPDGALYVVAEQQGQVLRFDGKAFAPVVESGLSSPTGLAFEADGNMLVGDYGLDNVQRFAADGSLLAVVASGLDGPDAGLMLGSDGWLWVPCFEADALVRVDPASGAVEDWLSDVRSPRSLVEVDGEAWLTSWRGSAVLRVTPGDSEPVTVAEVAYPSGLAIDGDNVWVASDQRAQIQRLSGSTGELLDTVSLSDSGVDGLTFLALGPDPRDTPRR